MAASGQADIRSISNPTWEYDVFLSFRGEDTRLKFTDHLYHALCRAGINTFRDDEKLRIGDELRPTLLGAIKYSRISIIVFSRNYASSSSCLDELVKILECNKEKKQAVLPIFYEVNPSDVRHQTGSFRTAMVMHEKRYKGRSQKVEKWRSALRKAANLKGESYKNEPEFEFVDKIIQKISSILNHRLLHLPERAVGLESRKLQVLSLLGIGLNNLDVSMMGIYGPGGVGKTTIAKAVYNTVAVHFEITCFCSDVREKTNKHELAHVQQNILADMLRKNDINSHRDIRTMKERLHNKRVLLVLDDVDKLKQLQSLAGGCDWFGPGSRVIITTRDKQLLSRHGIEKIYEAKELDKEEALELLCWNAFKSNQPKSGFDDVSTRVASYARGIPLALEIIGSHLFGKDENEWKSAMDGYQKSMDKEIYDILRVSYDSLDYNEREIFLDVAFFFRGYKLTHVEEILGGCGFSPKSGLSVLEDKCLVKRQHGNLWMHDLTQSMGREIVRRESEREPGERSRIWFHEDALQVLIRDTGTSKVQGLMLVLPQKKEVLWSGNAFKKMVNLRILIIHNAVFLKAPKELPNSLRVLEWENYLSSSLPSNFYGDELRLLRWQNTPQIVQLQETVKRFHNITTLVIEDCDELKEVPDLSTVPNLTRLQLDGCLNLVKIHDSVGFLQKLMLLSTTDCFELMELPRSGFKSLQLLNICGNERLKNLPLNSKILIHLAFSEAGTDFQSDSGSRLIQELLKRHYSIIYHLPEATIPQCFCYRSNKNSISFWIRKILPDVHFIFAIKGPKHDVEGLDFRLCIGSMETNLKIAPPDGDAAKIFSLFGFVYTSFDKEDFLKIDELYRSENWVRVDVCLVTILKTPPASTSGNHTSDASVMECGAYVSQTCDGNISFVDPYNWYSIENKSFTTGERVGIGGLSLTTVEKNDGFSFLDQLWKKIMRLNVPSEVKQFACAAIFEYLPSSTSLRVLKEWQWAREAWLLSSLELRLDRVEVNNFSEWMLNLASILDTESLELFMVIAWGIWSEWEKLRMGFETEDPSSLIRRICVVLEDYRITRRPMNQHVQEDEETDTDPSGLIHRMCERLEITHGLMNRCMRKDEEMAADPPGLLHIMGELVGITHRLKRQRMQTGEEIATDPPGLLRRVDELLTGCRTATRKNDTLSSDLLRKKIMFLNVPPQVQHFAWTAVSDYLRKFCKCGKRNEKIPLQVLKNNLWSRDIWLLSPLGLRVDRMKANSLCEWMLKLDSTFDTESLEMFMVIAWGIWNEWDKSCMGLKLEDPPSLISRMCVLLEDYRNIHRPMQQTEADYRPSSQPVRRDDDIFTDHQPSSQPVCQRRYKYMDEGKQIM